MGWNYDFNGQSIARVGLWNRRALKAEIKYEAVEGATDDDKTNPSVFLKIKKVTTGIDVEVHPMAAEEPYFSRMRNIQEACDASNYSDSIDLSRIIYDDEHQVVMCVVPKNSCTTWKAIMWYLIGNSTLEDAFNETKYNFTLNRGPFKTMKILSKDEVLTRLNHYTKFMVTRHPFERLLSAQQNKFNVPPTMFSYSWKKGREAALHSIQRYLPGLQLDWSSMTKAEHLSYVSGRVDFRRLSTSGQQKVLHFISQGYNGNVDFDQFINYFVLKKTKRYDVHWRPQDMLCNPCAINYDYVIDFDNLYEESQRLLSWLQRNDPPEKWIHFPVKTSGKTRKSTKQFIEILEPEAVKQLKSLYANDFKYFSHDLEKY